MWLVCVQIETLAKRFDRECAWDSVCFVVRAWNYFCCIDCKTCRRQRLLDEFRFAYATHASLHVRALAVLLVELLFEPEVVSVAKMFAFALLRRANHG